jgi:hypothetical protein
MPIESAYFPTCADTGAKIPRRTSIRKSLQNDEKIFPQLISSEGVPSKENQSMNVPLTEKALQSEEEPLPNVDSLMEGIQIDGCKNTPISTGNPQLYQPAKARISQSTYSQKDTFRL